MSFQKSNIKLAKLLSDIVIYCKSVHFNGFEHAKDSHAFYEMSSLKESKALNLAETSGKQMCVLCVVWVRERCCALLYTQERRHGSTEKSTPFLSYIPLGNKQAG